MNWLRLHVSNVCNFKCPNCHVFEMTDNVQPSQLMPENIFIASIKTVTDFLAKNNKKNLSISLYGGETLANKKVIRKVIENQNKLFNQDIEINWILNTNGSLLDDDDAIFIKKHNIEVHLSVDGNENIHNLSRTFHNKKPTFIAVMNALNKIKQHNIRAQINSYVMPSNQHSLKEIVDIAKNFEIEKIYIDQFYSDQMLFDDSNFEIYQDLYLYSLSKNITLTGPWSRVKRNSDFRVDRITEYLQDFSIDINVDGSFYSSSIPSSKGNPISHFKLKNFIETEFKDAKQHQVENYKSSCNYCPISNQCLGIAKEQVWYHINSVANTNASCNFFVSWMNYLNQPLYVFNEKKFNVISLYSKNELQFFIEQTKILISELESKLGELDQPINIRVVKNLNELKYASLQFNLPKWATATTDLNTLYHLSDKPCHGLKHELAHLFINQINPHLPQWVKEGLCEWIDNQNHQKGFYPQHSLIELENSFDEFTKQNTPDSNSYYLTSKHFFIYIERLTNSEKMCHTLHNLKKLDLNQWLLSLTGLTLDETFTNFQKYDW